MQNTIHQNKWWAYSTAFIMSLNGGYINAICMVCILQNPVGYVTGDLTIAGESLVKGQFFLFLHLIALVICFLIGSVISGLVIKSQHFKIDRRYVTSLLFQSTSLFFAMILLFFHNENSGFLLAMTMGMQNAMTSHYGTALIRTTHMTGTTTDLGILISRWIKKDTVEFWKIKLYISLITGFGFGAILGVFSYDKFHVFSLAFSFLFYLFMMSWRLPFIEKIFHV